MYVDNVESFTKSTYLICSSSVSVSPFNSSLLILRSIVLELICLQYHTLLHVTTDSQRLNNVTALAVLMSDCH